MAQIRRSKLRCTCHGAIFERVLVRRTQEYKSIPRTTSRKSPEIAHVRRHGSLSCMPLFSLRATLSFSRCVFAERKRMCYYKNCVVLRRTATIQRSFVIIMRFLADYESFHSGKTQLSGVFKTKSADICEIPSSGLICNPLILISATFCDILK